MSSTFGYLIPSKEYKVGEFKKRIIQYFEARNIVDGYYEEEYQWFAAGDNSHTFFNFINGSQPHSFEYVEVQDSSFNRIIPDGTKDPYGARCPICKVSMDDTLSDSLMDLADTESEEGKEIDIANAPITCPGCNFNHKIGSINYESRVKFNNQFVCFVDIESEFSDQKLKELEKHLECTFEILYGRM